MVCFLDTNAINVVYVDLTNKYNQNRDQQKIPKYNLLNQNHCFY